MSANSRAALADDYLGMWARLRPGERPPGAPPRPGLAADIDAAVNLLLAGKDRYDVVEAAIGVPWWYIGIIHVMEGGGDFAAHPHNGDPLSGRTINVPAGRPANAAPPFEWEDSAVDLCEIKGWDADHVRRLPDGSADWTIPTTLWRAEANNGFGYRNRGVLTPYLVAGSNLEMPGRYISDSEFAPTKWSRQVGFATLLKVLTTRGIVTFEGGM
jgi:lysozyme family protein